MSEDVKEPLVAVAKPKKNPMRLLIILVQVIVVVSLLFVGASLYRTILNQATELNVTQKDITEQKDQISSLKEQVNSLNDKIRDFKKQADELDNGVNAAKSSVASMKNNYETFETRVNDLNQELDDKFGRMSKELSDVHETLKPLNESMDAWKKEAKEWQKDYATALSDVQSHVTRAAGLVAQLRDETNKKIDFISMVQEKMIKDMQALNNAPIAIKTNVPAVDRVVHRQILNSTMLSSEDKADYQAQKN